MGIHSKVKAVFLDRDGVINKAVVIDGKPYPPSSIAELVIADGVKEGLLKLKQLGFLLIVVTNQPDVARGKTPINVVSEINDFLIKDLHLDDFYCCFHDTLDNCECRKPKPAMILKAAKKWNIDLKHSFMVGDRWRDIETGKNAGIKTLLIEYGYDEKYVEPDFVCLDFQDVVKKISTSNNS